MPTHAGGRGTRRAPSRDRRGKLLIAPPRTRVAVRFDLPPDLYQLLVWAARRHELPLEEYLFDMVEEDVHREVEQWERAQTEAARQCA